MKINTIISTILTGKIYYFCNIYYIDVTAHMDICFT